MAGSPDFGSVYARDWLGWSVFVLPRNRPVVDTTGMPEPIESIDLTDASAGTDESAPSSRALAPPANEARPRPILLRSGSKVGLWSHLVQCDRVLDDRVQMMLQVGPFDLGHMRDPEVHIGVSARFGHDGRLLPSCLHDPHHHRETAPPRSARDLPTSNGWKQQC